MAYSIIEFKSSGKNIVLSRKDIIERDFSRESDNLKKTVKEGSILETKVTRIENYGIFVKIGPFEGLVHKSELSLSRLISPENFKPGDPVNVKVKEIDWNNNKFSLSIKDTFTDPWKAGISEYETGKNYPAAAVKFIKSGAFMELEPGLEGYLPVQRMSYTRRINNPEDILQLHGKYDVKIVEIDHSGKKILLELESGESNPWETADDISSKIHECTVEKKLPGGLIVRLENGMEGFIPKDQLQNYDSISSNAVITAGTLEFDRYNKKLVLSPKAAEEMKEQLELRDYMNKNQGTSSTASLGDMFKDVLNNIKTDR